ncbi:MAG: asparagine synthase-related protein [Candidatus Sphingomonas phytovorans]|nr:asparagine synthase-related protein [Sphingomonas sp.]WEK02188.1 MAG: asparagine synthase-related protein [Sphingomonas sp.]
MTGAAFLAVLHPAGRPEADVPATPPPGLELRFENPLLTVYADAAMPTTALGANGLALGSVFRKGAAAPVERLDGAAPATLANSLIDRCWGDYVALIADPTGAAVHIVRAPSGGVHAYRARRGPVAWLASDIALLRHIGAVRAAIHWTFVAHHLAFAHLHTGDTGIADVDEVMPGSGAIERGTRCDRINLWSPWHFAPSGDRLSFDDSARTVRTAVLQSVEALVAPSDSLALELSGGLDSSIVAAALAATGRHAVAINLSTPGPEGDERLYARAVAARCGMTLVEKLVDGDIDLTASAALAPRPGMLAMLRLADRQFATIGEEHEVTGFINGTGGDCVFCSLGTVAPAVDRLHAEGVGLGLLHSIGDVAEVHQADLWKVAGLTFGKRRRHRPSPIWRRNGHFLNGDRLPDEPVDHPWLVEPDDALGGTRAHIQAILASYAHLDGYGRQQVARSIFPLLSQPVVEACVAIPSWLWVAGGRDRAVARAAFRGLLPDLTLDRRTKGGMEAFCARTFALNRDRFKPFLLDGLLAAAGLLDIAAIEACLDRPFANRDTLFYHLLPIADTEAWARGVVAAASDPVPAMARQR